MFSQVTRSTFCVSLFINIIVQLIQIVLIYFLFFFVDPPSTPIITGYLEGSVIPAGSNQKLLCMSSGGNPPATLTWYKNDKKITANTKAQDNSVQSELLINANITDNQARYRCEAQNSATDVPLFETKVLSVHCKLYLLRRLFIYVL